MSDRKEERERLRQQRLAQQQSRGSSERSRLVLGYVVAGVLTLAVLVGLVLVITGGSDSGEVKTPGEAHIQPLSGSFEGLDPDTREGTPPPELQFGDLEESAAQAGCKLQLDLPIQGSTHIDNKEPYTYDTNPPTSGNHNPNPAADGAYKTPMGAADADGNNVRNFVHSLEHGRIEIHYSPDLPEADQLALKGVFDEDPGGILMFPDPNIDDDVAFAAWGQLATCPKYDPLALDVLRNFRDTFRGNGPEGQIPVDL